MNNSAGSIIQGCPVDPERWGVHIDRPDRRVEIPKHIRINGWAFEKSGIKVMAIRARVRERKSSGKYGMERPDVAQTFPGQRHAGQSGFEVKVKLGRGKNRVCLEALLQSDGGGHDWVPFTCLEFLRASLFQRMQVVLDFGFWMNFREDPWNMWQKLDAGKRLLIESLIEQHSIIRLGELRQYEPRPLISETRTDARYDGKSHFVIVTPSFNQAKFLRQTIESIVYQEAANVAYVIQDAGSQDGSVEIVREYEKKIASWVSEKDDGQADAIAKGFSKVAAEPEDIMGYINSDDIYLPNTFKLVGDYFDANPDVDVLYGNRIIIDENGDEIGRWHLPPHNDGMLSIIDYVPQETMFWRRSAYIKAGGIDKNFKFAMDWDLLMRFRKAKCRIVRLPTYLAAFRVHTEQKTSTIINSIGIKESQSLRERECGGEVNNETIQEAVRCMRLVAAYDEWCYKSVYSRFGMGKCEEEYSRRGAEALR